MKVKVCPALAEETDAGLVVLTYLVGWPSSTSDVVEIVDVCVFWNVRVTIVPPARPVHPGLQLWGVVLEDTAKEELGGKPLVVTCTEYVEGLTVTVWHAEVDCFQLKPPIFPVAGKRARNPYVPEVKGAVKVPL